MAIVRLQMKCIGFEALHWGYSKYNLLCLCLALFLEISHAICYFSIAHDIINLQHAILLQPIMKNEISPHYLIHFLSPIMHRMNQAATLLFLILFESSSHIFFKSERRYIECFIWECRMASDALLLETWGCRISDKKCNSSLHLCPSSIINSEMTSSPHI